MARWIKRIVLTVAAVIGLLLLTGVALSVLLDPNDYKDDIEAAVEEQTGRAFTIEGDIRLSLFPWIGVEVGRMTLADEPEYEEPFVEVDGLRAAVRVVPLIRGRIETEVFAVESPFVRLIVDEDGVGNWESLQAHVAAEDDETDDEAAAPDEETELPEILQDAVIGGIRVRDAGAVWDDRAEGLRVQVDSANLDMDTVRLGAPIAVRGDVRASGDEDFPDLRGEWSTRVEVARSLDEIRFEGLEASLEARGREIPGYQQSGAIAGHGTVALGDTIEIDWPEFRVAGAGVQFEAALTATIGETVEADASWSVEPFNLKATLGLLDIEAPRTTNTSALTAIGAGGELALRDEDLELRDLEVQLDRSTLTGDASVSGFENPALRFTLDLDEIDADAYLPPEDREAAAEDPTRGTRGMPDLEQIELDLPLELLRELDVDGDISVGEIGLMNLSLEALTFNVSAADGRLGINDLDAELYGGAVSGDVGLDARGDYPYFDVDFSLEETRFEPLVMDLLEMDRGVLDGRGTFRLRGDGGGANVHEFVESFTGDAEVDVADGAVVGINLSYEIARAAAVLGRGQTPDEPAAEDRRTVFAALSATVDFADGVATNDNLRADTPLLRVRGEGEVDLLQERIDYLVRATVTGDLADGDGKTIAAIRDVTVPVRFTGNLFDPSIRPDLAEALSDEQMQRLRGVRESIDETQERLRDEVEERTQDGADRLREEAEERLRRFRR